MSLKLTSPAFEHEGEIPARHTCEGDDIPPELSWSEVPGGAASLALILDDPDDTPTTWVHWVLYNIPVSATGLAEGVSPHDLPSGTLEGLNDWKSVGWRGPCPPQGRHRYVYKLYALDTVLPDLHHPTKAKLETAMDGHILAKAELIGTYEKAKKGFVDALFGR
jgi:Raf kinase inhibitor-like YbhB/YbcL family protein